MLRGSRGRDWHCLSNEVVLDIDVMDMITFGNCYPLRAVYCFKVDRYLLKMNPLRRSLRMQLKSIRMSPYCTVGYIYKFSISYSRIRQIQVKLSILWDF